MFGTQSFPDVAYQGSFTLGSFFTPRWRCWNVLSGVSWDRGRRGWGAARHSKDYTKCLIYGEKSSKAKWSGIKTIANENIQKTKLKLWKLFSFSLARHSNPLSLRFHLQSGCFVSRWTSGRMEGVRAIESSFSSSFHFNLNEALRIKRDN